MKEDNIQIEKTDSARQFLEWIQKTDARDSLRALSVPYTHVQ